MKSTKAPLLSIKVRRRWYCSNVTRCERARSDIPYWESDIRDHGAVCSAANGCRGPLTEGKRLDPRPRLIAAGFVAVVIVAAAVWTTSVVLFPPPLQHVDFAQHEVHVDDKSGTLALQVSRTDDLKRRETVQFRSVDGTAKGGVNFEAAEGTLVFQPGEASKSVRITLLPVGGYLKSDLYFHVTLTNVAGQPQQVVFIEEPKVDAPLKIQAERVVRAVSVVAKDIADQVVRERVVMRLLAGARDDQRAFEQYRGALETVQGNLRRSREVYVQSFHDMSSMQPRAVMDAMDQVSEDLSHKGFTQQSRATAIMKRQYGEFLAKGNTDMDRWADELSSVVPSAQSGAASPL